MSVQPEGAPSPELVAAGSVPLLKLVLPQRQVVSVDPKQLIIKRIILTGRESPIYLMFRSRFQVPSGIINQMFGHFDERLRVDLLQDIHFGRRRTRLWPGTQGGLNALTCFR